MTQTQIETQKESEDQNLQILFLSHYHSGSHKQHAQQYQRFSRHKVDVVHLDGEGDSFWKAKILFGTFMNHLVQEKNEEQNEEQNVSQPNLNSNNLETDLPIESINPTNSTISINSNGLINSKDPIDLICSKSKSPCVVIATSMTNLSVIRCQFSKRNSLQQIKFVYYMHESQLLYPKKPALGFDDQGPYRRDLGQAKLFTHIQFESMMAADAICWNSYYHYNTFIDRFRIEYLRSFRLDRETEEKIISQIKDRSKVIYVGVDLLNRFGDHLSIREKHLKSLNERDKPIILWNMRWEYDKNPIQFIKILQSIKFESKIPFSLIVCGGHAFKSKEQEQKWFIDQLEPFKNEIIHLGYANPDLYINLLTQADIVVSTAIHEFFGIAIVEAIHCHTYCILPNDLSYPELFSKSFQEKCLYDTYESDLTTTSMNSSNSSNTNSSNNKRKKKNSMHKKSSLHDILHESLLNWKSLPYDEIQIQSDIEKYDWIQLATEYDKHFQQISNLRLGVKRK